MKKFNFYNDNTKEAMFKIIDKGKVFIGKAKAHPEDAEIAGRLTGVTIAEFRARIKREDSKCRESKRKVEQLKKELAEAERNVEFYANRKSCLETDLKAYLTHKATFQRRYKNMKNRRKVIKK